MSRALLIAAVTALLALPMLSSREQPAPARDRVSRADVICLGHDGVHAITPRLITCYDGALHRWDGSHVRRRVPVLTSR